MQVRDRLRRLSYVALTSGLIAASAVFVAPTTAHAQSSQPTITSIVSNATPPDSGPVGGGQQILIFGTGFTNVQSVDFNADVQNGNSTDPLDSNCQAPSGSPGAANCAHAPTFTVVSSTEIIATTPPSPLQMACVGTTTPKLPQQAEVDVFVEVPNPGGSGPNEPSSQSSTDRYAYLAGSPAISQMSDGSSTSSPTTPAVGNASDTLTITGTNLVDDCGTGAPPTSSPNTSVLFDNNTAATHETISGTDQNGTITVTVPSKPSNGLSLETVRVQVPPVDTSGQFTELGGGTSPDNPRSDQFVYYYKASSSCTTSGGTPTVTAVVVGDGPNNAPQPVSIDGSGLTNPTSVTFGGNAAPTVVPINDCQLIAYDPTTSTTGQVQVQVTTGAGSSAANGVASAYTYNSPMTVTSVSPNGGPPAGGTTVTITGTGFDSSGNWVLFDGVPTSPSSESATSIKVSSPGHQPGAVDVVVNDSEGAATPTNANDKFTYTGPPTISGVAPGGGPTKGGNTVRIFGSNLLGATDVEFCMPPDTPHVTCTQSPTSSYSSSPDGSTLSVTAPDVSGTTKAGTYDIMVTTGSGNTTGTGLYQYQDPPTVTKLSPTSGPGSGNTTVTITGTNLQNVQTITFGTATAPTPYQTGSGGSTLTVNSPPSPLSSPGVVDVRVTTYGGTSAINRPGDQFDYTTPGPHARPQVAVGVEGETGAIYGAAPQLGTGWHGLGGRTIGAPAVAAVPTSSGPANPLFVATGTNHTLYVRSLHQPWHVLGRSYCLDNPAAAVIGGALYVACEGGNHALYVGATGVPSTGLPTISHFSNLGGVLAAGPALASVGGPNGTVFFFATGKSGGLYTRTVHTGWGRLALTCTGHPAAGIASAGSTTYVACDSGGHLLYITSNGHGWSARTNLGGALVNGPGVAATNLGVFFLVEGRNHNAYVHGLSGGWVNVGGYLLTGVGSVGLN
jgi:hypothetical protein